MVGRPSIAADSTPLVLVAFPTPSFHSYTIGQRARKLANKGPSPVTATPEITPFPQKGHLQNRYLLNKEHHLRLQEQHLWSLRLHST